MIRITFFNGLGFIFFSFIKSYVVIYFFGGSGIDLGIIMAMQPLARLISMPIIGYLTDHVSKKTLVLIGSLGRTISYFFYWYSLVSYQILLLGLGSFLQGLLVGFFWPPFFALISEKSNKENRTQALAKGRGKMIGYGFLIGAFISIPMFALVSIYMSENIPLMYSPLLLFSIINLIAGVKFYLKVDENLTYENYQSNLNELNPKSIGRGDINLDNFDTSKHTVNIREPKHTNRTFYMILFTFLCFCVLFTSISQNIYYPFITTFLIERHLYTLSEQIVPILVMIIYFPAQVLSQLFSPTLGKIFDRISAHYSIIFIAFFNFLTLWLIVATISLIDFTITLILLYTTIQSNNYLIQAIMSRISIKDRGKILGLNLWLNVIGRVIGPLLGGFLWDYISFSSPFLISMFVGILLVPCYIISLQKLKSFMVEK